MKRILVPVDFSKQAAHALQFALDLAEKVNAKITVLNVVEYPIGGSIDPTGFAVPVPIDAEFLDIMKKNVERRMSRFLEKTPNSVVVEDKVEIGNPYIAITQHIIDHKIDMVVMGTKGASGFKEFFIGSNAEKIVRMAQCPVITMHEKAKVQDIKNIVFAISPDDFSDELVSELKRLQELFHAKLHLVRINTPNNFQRDVLTKAAYEKAAIRYMLKDYTINIFNDLYEDQGILSFAQHINADMIALGTHGRTGMGHLISGSIAEDIVNHATQPIWTCHLSKK